MARGTPGALIGRPQGQLTDEVRRRRASIDAGTVYSLEEAAHLLVMGERRVRAMLRSGEIPARRDGHRWRVLGQALRLWLWGPKQPNQYSGRQG